MQYLRDNFLLQIYALLVLRNSIKIIGFFSLNYLISPFRLKARFHQTLFATSRRIYSHKTYDLFTIKTRIFTSVPVKIVQQVASGGNWS
jgi:hypothetical protein